MREIKIEKYDNDYQTRITFRAWWENEKALITIGSAHSIREIFVMIQEWVAMNWMEEDAYVITIIDRTT